MDNTFHMIGLCLTKGEATSDFKFGFQAIIDGLKDLNPELSFKPTVLVCDAASAIENAAISVFGNQILVRMCFAHMVSNVTKKFKKLPSVKSDLKLLWGARNIETFEEMLELFLTKYDTIDPLFTEYFKVRYILT